MSTECYPISTLFPTSRLFRDFLGMEDSAERASLRRWYGASPLGGEWMAMAAKAPALGQDHRNRLADALAAQCTRWGASPETHANIEKIRGGARAVVSGQQVGLFGGPLLTLLKAATAVARSKQATHATGIEHVPIFWLATEDHDLAEINHVALLSKTAVETIGLAQSAGSAQAAVGALRLGADIERSLGQAIELLGYAPITEILRECYAGSAATFASGFAGLMTRLFSAHGLIVLDASERPFHELGSHVLRSAITQADALDAALLQRTAELEAAGYHAQVLVKPGASLLFLIDRETGARLALRRLPDGSWKAGAGASAQLYQDEDLLAILEEEPERLSPNALLRPVFQDALLPTTAYIGGPAEIAYFAQSAVVYERVLGRVTPILPRLSATLIEPEVAAVMAQHEVGFPDALSSVDELSQRLGARAMPIEAKRRLADAGNALDAALEAAQSYLGSLDEGLGRSAGVSASKMRYQMNRLRRLAANFELQRETSLRKHAAAIALHLFPEGHPQERLLGGAYFLAAWENAHGTPASELIDRLVREAANQCPGHLVIRI